jgi:hypothetical protein
MARTFQSRLGAFHDRLRRKLTDNQISLTAQAADCIRITYKRNKEGDIKSRVVDSADVVSVIFPILQDVPYRRLTKDAGGLRIDTLPAVTELFPFQIMVPHNQYVYRDDLIFRIFRDQPDNAYNADHDYYLTDTTSTDMLDGTHNITTQSPIIMVLQIKEPLGTFGVESMIWSKYNCTYSDEVLPTEILETVVSLANRRLALGW